MTTGGVCKLTVVSGGVGSPDAFAPFTLGSHFFFSRFLRRSSESELDDELSEDDAIATSRRSAFVSTARCDFLLRFFWSSTRRS